MNKLSKYGRHVGTLVCQRKMKLVQRWYCTVHTCPSSNLSCIYIYIYLYRGKQTIYKHTDIQTYPYAYSNTLKCIYISNIYIYRYKFICNVPYLRRNPCQEEILTGQHHGFPLNGNPMILLRFQCGFFPLL